MNDEELDFYITRIICGYLLFSYNGEKYQLKYPSNQLKYEANLLYDSIINDEKYSEWIRAENILRVLIMLGLWTKDTEKYIEQTDKKIENLKVQLFQSFSMKDIREKTREKIRSHEGQMNRVNNIKNEFLSSNTLEGYASSLKHEFIVCNTLYKNNKLVFNIDDIKDNSSYQYFNQLVNEINHHVIPVKTYKNIARSNSWRSYWNCNKEYIFNKQVVDWTDEQRSLVNITKMYDNVYGHPDCPDDKIIEDDDALDGWLIVQRKKVKKDKLQAQLDDSNPNLRKAQEVFIIAPNQESVEDIMEMNSSEAIYRMKEKFEYLKNSTGDVEDLALPDVQRAAREKLINGLK